MNWCGWPNSPLIKFALPPPRFVIPLCSNILDISISGMINICSSGIEYPWMHVAEFLIAVLTRIFSIRFFESRDVNPSDAPLVLWLNGILVLWPLRMYLTSYPCKVALDVQVSPGSCSNLARARLEMEETIQNWTRIHGPRMQTWASLEPFCSSDSHASKLQIIFLDQACWRDALFFLKLLIAYISPSTLGFHTPKEQPLVIPQLPPLVCLLALYVEASLRDSLFFCKMCGRSWSYSWIDISNTRSFLSTSPLKGALYFQSIQGQSNVNWMIFVAMVVATPLFLHLRFTSRIKCYPSCLVHRCSLSILFL